MSDESLSCASLHKPHPVCLLNSETIKHVTVYKNGATIKHHIEHIDSFFGNIFIIEGIPTACDISTLNIQVSTYDKTQSKTIECDIVSIMSLVAPTQRTDKNEKKYLDEFKNVKNEDDYTNRRINFLFEAHKKYKDKLLDNLELVDFSSDKIKDILYQISDLHHLMADLNTEYSINTCDVSAARSKFLDYFVTKNNDMEMYESYDYSLHYKDNYIIQVQLDSTNLSPDNEFTLTVSYFTNNASWEPEYSLTINNITKQLDLSCYGLISQQSRIDWCHKKILLSSLQFNEIATIPVLPKEIISLKETQTFSTSKVHPRMLMARQTHGDDGQDLTFKSASLDSSNSSVTLLDDSIEVIYMTKYETDILSWNAKYRIPLFTTQTPFKLAYICIPKEERSITLLAKFQNNSIFPILSSSKVKVFFDNVQVGLTKFEKPITQTSSSCIPVYTDKTFIVHYSTEIFTSNNSVDNVPEKETCVKQKVCITGVQSCQDAPLAIILSYPKSIDSQVSCSIKYREKIEIVNFISDYDAIFELASRIGFNTTSHYTVLNKATHHIIDISSSRKTINNMYEFTFCHVIKNKSNENFQVISSL